VAKKPKVKLAGHPLMERLAANVAALGDAQRERLAAMLSAPTVTETLRDAIERGPLTRYKLSQLTGVDQGTLSRFVAGHGGFSLDTLDMLCAALGLALTPAKRTRTRRKG
jgi:hypothetical protein